MSTLPIFAVVGHPNKGKSSIVAALTHSDAVAISALSGTTTQAQAFDFYVAGNANALYRLVDTPGFQRPRQMLELLNEQTLDASQRIAAINNFIACHAVSAKESGRFSDEIELLTPIMAGAGILYVVDGSVPYAPEYEAEMTLLQWTGQPRMALINPIGGEHYVAQWQAALGQFFNIVRVFNPMTDGIEKQCSVLNAFAELYPKWRQQLILSQQEISQQKNQHAQQAAQLISGYMADVLPLHLNTPLVPAISGGQLLRHVQAGLEENLKNKYKLQLGAQEEKYQQAILALYAHHHVVSEANAMDINYPDLFDQNQWYLFGLTRKKLVLLSAGGGAAAGAVLDLGVGGTSLMTGAILGGLTSAAASFYLSAAPEKISLKNIPLGGQQLTIGPIKNLQFAFVLLGRALSFQRAVALRSHANRNIMLVNNDHESTWLNRLTHKQQLQLTRLLQQGYKGLSEQDIQLFNTLLNDLLADKP